MSAFRFDTRLVIAGGALALAGGMLAAGCGGDAPVDYTLQSTFCQQAAMADCSDPAVRACYGSSDATVGADTQTCVTARSTPERCNPQTLPYHPAYAQPCVDAHTNVYMSAPSLDPGALQAMQSACEAVFNKALPRGSSCTADTDCDVGGGNLCVVHQGKGTCQTPNAVMPGDPCSDPAAQCPTNYICDSGAHCVAAPGKGQACGVGVPCGPMLRCDTSSMLCANQLADGVGGCNQGSDCTGGFCLVAGGGTVCAAAYTLALGSATCADFKPK